MSEVSGVSICAIIGTSLLSSWLAPEAESTFDSSERRPPNSCDSPDAFGRCSSDP
jgi:hypothetical protein